MLRKARLGRIKRRPLKSPKSKLPSLEDFLENRDYQGASTLLEFQSKDRSEVETSLWKAYCAFHNGDFAVSQEFYVDLLTGDYNDVPDEAALYLACTYYKLQMYEEAMETLDSAPENALKHRIMFHLAKKLDMDDLVVELRQKLKGGVEDRLSKAAMLYEEGLYQDATDIFKRVLADNRDSVALNVYVAMCYFKMDYYDVSQEILSVYEQMRTDSIFVKNLKACTNFRLYNGSAALDELRTIGNLEHLLLTNDLLRHNFVVFTDGQQALKHLPPLVDTIAEARLNLAIYHLRNDDCEEAEMLLEDLNPVTPQELILKGVVKATIGQRERDPKAIQKANSFFQAVGDSPTETDTIPGRQCMASSLFLQKHFDDANVYFSSVKSYLVDDDVFCWNYGLSLAAAGNFIEAEEILLQVRNPSYNDDIYYKTWLSRCFISNGKENQAWTLYPAISSDTDRVFFLKVVANDCYRKKKFLVAAKAFNVLETLDDGNDYILALKGSCIGVLRSIVIEKSTNPDGISSKGKSSLFDTMDILQNHLDVAELKSTITTIKQWLKSMKI